MPMANAMAPINSASITHLTQAGKAPLPPIWCSANGVQASFCASNGLTVMPVAVTPERARMASVNGRLQQRPHHPLTAPDESAACNNKLGCPRDGSRHGL